MGCMQSKSTDNALSHLDDSVKVMVRHDQRVAQQHGVQTTGYRPRAPHPLVHDHDNENRDTTKPIAVGIEEGGEFEIVVVNEAVPGLDGDLELNDEIQEDSAMALQDSKLVRAEEADDGNIPDPRDDEILIEGSEIQKADDDGEIVAEDGIEKPDDEGVVVNDMGIELRSDNVTEPAINNASGVTDPTESHIAPVENVTNEEDGSKEKETDTNVEVEHVDTKTNEEGNLDDETTNTVPLEIPINDSSDNATENPKNLLSKSSRDYWA